MADTFFYEPTLDEHAILFELNEGTAHHCAQVLRMKEGEAIEITNGRGLLCTASIETISKKNCTVKILQRQFYPPAEKKVTVAISLLKNTDRFEWFLEKATELGIHEIVPLICNRTIRQNFRKDRMENITVAAMLQSRQTWLPHLHDAVTVEDWIRSSSNTTKLIAYCGPAQKKEMAAISLSPDTEILIGPEGDFSPVEILLAAENSYVPVSLGDTRLRTETAGVVASALLMNKIKS